MPALWKSSLMVLSLSSGFHNKATVASPHSRRTWPTSRGQCQEVPRSSTSVCSRAGGVMTSRLRQNGLTDSRFRGSEAKAAPQDMPAMLIQVRATGQPPAIWLTLVVVRAEIEVVVVDGEPAAVEVIGAQDFVDGREHLIVPGHAPGAGGVHITDRGAVQKEPAIEQIGIRSGRLAGRGILAAAHFEIRFLGVADFPGASDVAQFHEADSVPNHLPDVGIRIDLAVEFKLEAGAGSGGGDRAGVECLAFGKAFRHPMAFVGENDIRAQAVRVFSDGFHHGEHILAGDTIAKGIPTPPPRQRRAVGTCVVGFPDPVGPAREGVPGIFHQHDDLLAPAGFTGIHPHAAHFRRTLK